MLKKTLPTVSLALGLMTVAPLALAGPEAGDKSFLLSGTGTSDDSFDANSFGATGQIGWFITDALELGVRQSVSGVVLDDASDSWAGSTRGYADLNFGKGTVVPFVGLNAGGIYGEGVNETGTGGLEAGLKFYVKEKTFVLAQAEYQFLFEDADEIDDQFDDGAYFYSVGVGFNF